MTWEPAWSPLGDTARRIARPTGVAAAELLAALRAVPGIDVVVTDAFVAVYFDPAAPPADPSPALAAAVARAPAVGREHVVGVRYDGEDLGAVAMAVGLSVDEVISLHTAPVYEVLFLGFLPGFAYLGGLDPRLRVPRRASPRARVPAGAVGVAGPYTAVYPSVSPGGWSLLGVAAGFAPWDGERALLQPGDRVRMVPA